MCPQFSWSAHQASGDKCHFVNNPVQCRYFSTNHVFADIETPATSTGGNLRRLTSAHSDERRTLPF